ncbi:MAG: hypothetical protein LC676_11090 [Loktanella sp.]|nr:hypothetical protein [Loktanella sp.]
MKSPGTNRFLDRPAYRQRRLRDAARMLPVAGAALWMVPLLSQVDPEGSTGAAGSMIYVFGVWVVLIVAAGLIARRMRHDDAESPPAANSGASPGGDQ